jgi:hypothetical protein
MHAIHFREVIAKSWPTVPAGTREVKEVELRDRFRLGTRICAKGGCKKGNQTEKFQARLAGAQSRKVPRPGGDRRPSLSAG